MPIEVTGFDSDKLAGFFAKRPRGAEDVEDYIEILEAQKVAIGGRGIGLKTTVVKAEATEESPNPEPYTILSGSVDDDDPGGVTIRAAKRRFGIAGRELGFKIVWREPEGWLIGKAVELPPEEEENGQVS